MQEAIILGGGIIGLASAYYLQKNGYKITVIDRQAEVGLETSFANGAQLSYSYVAPLAEPSVLPKLPHWLLDRQSPLRFKPSLDPADLCWGLKFLKACNASLSRQTTRELLSLSFLSRDLFHELQPQLGDISFAAAGKLVMHRDPSSFAHAQAQLQVQQQLGCKQEALDIQQCIAKEPALAPLASTFCGGIYTDSEEVADSYKFCLALKHLLEQQGAQFLTGRTIMSLRQTPDQRVSLQLDDGQCLQAPVIVAALGSFTPQLLKPLGLSLPIAPLKGYSLTLEITQPQAAPHISITDFQKKVVFARLDHRLRVAGMADRVGLDQSLARDRIDLLKQQAKAVFPEAGSYDEAITWAGLRPATPKGKPIIDKTPFKNLYINSGQGALGLTLALGSAALLVDVIEGQNSRIDVRPFSLAQA
ncbi:D-amino acid dehydrogenase [Brackiella oedipodis]|uniref:D-amino acid dehydrogenase n=1 Tax=Brackiella oedipodis TaxID=124225 RepID=UPI0004914842|nr:D-amino acid dehydrogenase [Brackiella oedipodis]